MKVLDLFSGIGGFSLGLERAGMKTVAFCENDKCCQAVLKKHWPDITLYEDIKKIKYKNGRIYYGMNNIGKRVNIDLICGGFPCQDISVAGNKKGIKGERSGLWKEFKRIIKEVKPRYAIIENVANLRNNGLAEVIKDLWQIGYVCEWHIISARSVGAYHLRERVWIIAYPSSAGVQRLRVPSGTSKELAEPVHLGSDKQDYVTNSDMPRLWRAFASEEEKSKWWAETTAGFGAVFDKIHEALPTICRSNDGLSDRLDERARKERVKQLGNSVVPLIPELIGGAIIEWGKNNAE